MSGFHYGPQPLLAGVLPGQSALVLETASQLASALGSELICVYVDPTRFSRKASAEPEISFPIDPDTAEEANGPALFEHRLSRRLNTTPAAWRFTALAGEPAHELARFAEQTNARLIIVGARRRGVARTLENFATGSVAVHLTHHQHRPVLVVPLPTHHGADVL